MKDIEPQSSWTTKGLLIGAAAGAVAGSVGRFIVAFSFLYYTMNWGGPFFRTSGGVSAFDLLASKHIGFLLVSASLGLLVGAAGGVTCRPIFGAVISGALSSLFCVGLFVVPANLAISLSGGGFVDYTVDQNTILVGLAVMSLVSAFAGGIGAAIGKTMV